MTTKGEGARGSGGRWISFDCFGTLIDWRAGYHAILEPLAGARTGALIDAYHEFEHPIEKERPHILYREVLQRAVERGAQKIGLALPPAQSDALVRRWQDLPIYPDTASALGALRAAGWKIGILTNCDEDLFARTLERHPVLRPDLLVTAERVRSYKPDLGHFNRFAAESGVERGSWVHAACSWFHDVVPAHGLGVATIYVDRERTGQKGPEATRVMTGVSGLAQAAAELVG
jgi:2-haloacid dehalogenase